MLRVVASQFAVKVLIGPALPGMVRLGEVDVALELFSNVPMVGEFAAVVEGDGLDRVGVGLHHDLDGVGDRPFGVALDATAFDETRRAFHQGDDRAAMLGTNDGVAFPVAKGLPGLDVRGALVDIDTIWNQMGGTTALLRTTAFTILPQQHRRPVVVAGLHVAVDQFIDPRRRQFQAGIRGLVRDHIGAPVMNHAFMDVVEMARRHFTGSRRC